MKHIPSLKFVLLGLVTLLGPKAVAIEGTLLHAGLQRSYRLELPEGYTKSKNYPLLLAFHSGGGDVEGFERVAHLTKPAVEKGFITVFPEGVDHRWEDGRPERKTNSDDVGFIDELIAKISKDYSVDRTRIFSTGMANGALFSFRLACERSTLFAGVATVAMNMGTVLALSCEPTRPIPLLVMTGDGDKLVPAKGGQLRGPFGLRKYGMVMSIQDTVNFWLEKYNCAPQGEELTRETSTATPVTHTRYSRCSGSAKIDHYLIKDGGHTWPGGVQYLPPALIGPVARNLDASHEIVSFFAAIP